LEEEAAEFKQLAEQENFKRMALLILDWMMWLLDFLY
jgi:hypothetical protein